MDQEYDKTIRPILDAFDKISEILRNDSVQLPKIVVVGDQSSGKSSVLEAITGISLPRGQNTVTKCPLILQSRQAKDKEYAEIYIETDNKEIKKVELQNLSQAIMDAQNCLTQKEEISDTPIHIKLFKNNSPELTLYDLPGLTYKTESIEKKIKSLISKYTLGKDTLIMLILPANADLTTSEAISYIKKNEDFKERTLAVITKIDLGIQEKGLFKKIINNELGLSFDPIVVRNRTQDELDNNESISSIREKEKIIIETSELSKLGDNSKGTDQLIKKLVHLQKEKLLNSKYVIKDQLIKNISTIKHDISKLPMSVSTTSEKINAFKNMLRTFENSYEDLMEGNNIEDKNNNIPARMQDKFVYFNQSNFLDHNSKFLSDSYYEKISDIVKESRGLKLANFMDTKAFKLLFSIEVTNIENNVYGFIDEIYSYMKHIILSLSKQAFKSFSHLKDAIDSEIGICFEEQKETVYSETNKSIIESCIAERFFKLIQIQKCVFKIFSFPYLPTLKYLKKDL